VSSRRWRNRQLRRFAAAVRGQRILEIGSGRPGRDGEGQSVRSIFDPSNDFLQTDIVPAFGHRILDVTTMELHEEFDIIICLNVLEHVYDFQAAVQRIYRALRPGGKTVIHVPFVYPYHDEPHDYWRFSEHALRLMLSDFRHLDLETRGVSKIPISVLAVATK
jgi:SAM-dependent methyltransferase